MWLSESGEALGDQALDDLADQCSEAHDDPGDDRLNEQAHHHGEQFSDSWSVTGDQAFTDLLHSIDGEHHDGETALFRSQVDAEVASEPPTKNTEGRSSERDDDRGGGAEVIMERPEGDADDPVPDGVAHERAGNSDHQQRRVLSFHGPSWHDHHSTWVKPEGVQRC